jgi:hypothetical protein
MFLAIVIIIILVGVIGYAIGKTGEGIDKTMDKHGYTEQEKHDTWTELALWSTFWGKKK